MAGSSGSGDDIEAGRTNFAESTTVVQAGRPDELDVPFNGLVAFEAGSRRDDQRPDTTVTGLLGRGWNGPVVRQPGAGVLGIGAPNRGPGLVGLGGGHRVSSTFLGSPGNLGESGLGGTGMIGIGGPGDVVPDGTAAGDVNVDVPSLPGAGGVGQGGTSFFPTPAPHTGDPGTGNGAGLIGIAGGRSTPPLADLSQGDLAATANVGVAGFGGDGPQTLDGGASFFGPAFAGAGMRGIGGRAQVAAGNFSGGPGIVGVAGGSTVPLDGDLVGIGVAGLSETGFGVFGRAIAMPGVSGTSDTAAGVAGNSDLGVGVAGSSDGSVGGYFVSQKVAQIHLEPHKEPTGDPNGVFEGRAGDLLVLRALREEQVATLWFCRTSGKAGAAIWVQVA